MIESITIQNFKSIRELELDLRSINVLIGPNGAGKSNFVNFFSFIHAIYEGQLGTYTAERGGAGRVVYLGSKKTQPLTGKLIFSNKYEYQFELKITDTDKFYFASEEKYILNDEIGQAILTIGDENHSSVEQKEALFRKDVLNDYPSLKSNFESFRVYHFHDTSRNSPLKDTARVADTRFLRANGSNLAAFLHDLQQNHVRSFNQIEATVKLIAPYFERFDLQPKGDYIRLNWRQKGSDMYLDASDFSDGTLRFIALCALLLQPDLPATILIDEPELGLHPFAINILGELVQSASVKSQVILSTQSINLVNQSSPDDVIIVENKNNESTFHRLNETELNDWLQEYTLGDLWNKNLIGGNP